MVWRTCFSNFVRMLYPSLATVVRETTARFPSFKNIFPRNFENLESTIR